MTPDEAIASRQTQSITPWGIRRTAYNEIESFYCHLSSKPMSIDQLMNEALSLPNDLRLQLVEQLLMSLESDVDETVQSDWLTEAKRRRDEVRDEVVQLIAGDDALAEVRQLLG